MTHSTSNLSDDAKRARIAQLDKELTEARKGLAMAVEALRPHTQHLARAILAVVAHNAPITHTQDKETQICLIAEYLLDTVAIPVLPSVAGMFVNVGLAEELVMYGHQDGLDMAFIDGEHLMHMAGFMDSDPDAPEWTPLLISLGESDTKH